MMSCEALAALGVDFGIDVAAPVRSDSHLTIKILAHGFRTLSVYRTYLSDYEFIPREMSIVAVITAIYINSRGS